MQGLLKLTLHAAAKPARTPSRNAKVREKSSRQLSVDFMKPWAYTRPMLFGYGRGATGNQDSTAAANAVEHPANRVAPSQIGSLAKPAPDARRGPQYSSSAAVRLKGRL